MVSLLFAGITLSSFDKEVMPELLTQGLQTPEGGRLLIGMLAGFIPEWWPTSNRNTRPVWIGIRNVDGTIGVRVGLHRSPRRQA